MRSIRQLLAACVLAATLSCGTSTNPPDGGADAVDGSDGSIDVTGEETGAGPSQYGDGTTCAPTFTGTTTICPGSIPAGMSCSQRCQVCTNQLAAGFPCVCDGTMWVCPMPNQICGDTGYFRLYSATVPSGCR